MEIRFLNDMKGVIYDQKRMKNAANFELYYMHRGIKKRGSLRYDITIIPPQMLGQEFVKTKGHEHSANYNEVYIVLEGIALYLIQKYAHGKVTDVYAVEAKKGEVVIVPPHYGHITINPSKKETLKEANWVSENCRNIYDLFAKKQGACYYYTRKGWIKNKKYGTVPQLRFEKPLKKWQPKLLKQLSQ